MPKKAKIHDIAQLAKVSPATVSRVLHNYRGVNEETRAAVQQAIQELGYIMPPPKAPERGSRMIGVMVGDTRNPFFSDMIYYLQNEFSRFGYVIVPFSIEFDSEIEKKQLSLAKELGLAALVLVSSMNTETLRQELSGITCPVMLTDRIVEGFGGNIVIQDNFQAGYIATKYLIDLGYHRIAFMVGNENSASSQRRVDGYRKALANAFLTVDESLIMPGKMSIKRGYQDGLAYIDQLNKMPHAALMANDLTAIGFLEACKERGVRVPEDISLVSFDGIELSSLKSFNLTTVRQPIEEMSQKICELTIKAIEEPGSRQDNRVMLEPTLIVRGSACENTHRN